RGAVRPHGVGGLGEEERGLALVLPHLADVFEIVAPHAPDSAHRKQLRRAGDRDGRLGRRRNDVTIVHGIHRPSVGSREKKPWPHPEEAMATGPAGTWSGSCRR